VSETAESAPAASAAGGNGPKKRALFQRKGNSKAAVRSREQQQAEDAITWGIIKPNLTAKKRWDGLIAMLILYSIIAVPLRIGFGVCMPLFSVEFYLDLCVDACFLFDIVLCFRTAVFTIDKTDETAQEQKLETDYKQIAKEYLRGWFLIDVASSVPLDTIMSLAFWAAGQGVDAAPPSPPAHFDIEDTLYRADPRCGGQADSGTNFLKLIRLIRLLKLARFLKLGRMVKRLEDQLDLNPAVLRFTILVVKIVFLCHLIACAWMFMHTLAADRRREDGFALTWLENYAQYYEDTLNSTQGGDNVRNDLGTQYLSAMYWAFTTLTTVGYGDIVPVNNDERIFTVVMEFVGLTVFGMVIGTITQIAADFNVQKKLMNERTRRWTSTCASAA